MLRPALAGAPRVSLPARPSAEASNGAGGVAAGAVLGATLGSAVPVVGTFLGGILGGIAGAVRAGAREAEREAELARYEEEAASVRAAAANQYLRALARSIERELDAHASRLLASLAPAPEPASAQERKLHDRAESVHQAYEALLAATSDLQHSGMGAKNGG